MTGWAVTPAAGTGVRLVEVDPELLSLWAWGLGLLVLFAAVKAVAVIRR